MKNQNPKNHNTNKDEFVTADINELCSFFYKAIEDKQGFEALKDFTDVLHTKKKAKNTPAANYAYELLKKAHLVKGDNQ